MFSAFLLQSEVHKYIKNTATKPLLSLKGTVMSFQLFVIISAEFPQCSIVKLVSTTLEETTFHFLVSLQGTKSQQPYNFYKRPFCGSLRAKPQQACMRVRVTDENN